MNITYRGYRITVTADGMFWVPAVSRGALTMRGARAIIDKDIKYHNKLIRDTQT